MVVFTSLRAFEKISRRAKRLGFPSGSVTLSAFSSSFEGTLHSFSALISLLACKLH
jgi:hypothetical protein